MAPPTRGGIDLRCTAVGRRGRHGPVPSGAEGWEVSLAGSDLYAGYIYLAEPETGWCQYWSHPADGFVSSSINHWLCSLHLVGTVLELDGDQTWDEDEAMEHIALALLQPLRPRRHGAHRRDRVPVMRVVSRPTVRVVPV
jgi:hypothetical protein